MTQGSSVLYSIEPLQHWTFQSCFLSRCLTNSFLFVNYICFFCCSEKLTDVDNFIAKSVSKEMETPEASVTPDPEMTEQDVSEKFERLNLFFEKNQQVSL